MQNAISHQNLNKNRQHAKASPNRPAFVPQVFEDADAFAAWEKYTAKLSCEIYNQEGQPLKILIFLIITLQIILQNNDFVNS